MTRSGKAQRIPWGRTVGLLTACLATLIGVGSGLDPDVILLRAAVSGVTLGVLARVMAQAWQYWLTLPGAESQPQSNASDARSRSRP
jgi:hypothetical protein